MYEYQVQEQSTSILENNITSFELSSNNDADVTSTGNTSTNSLPADNESIDSASRDGDLKSDDYTSSNGDPGDLTSASDCDDFNENVDTMDNFNQLLTMSEPLTMEGKIRRWAINNIDNLYLRTIKEILDILSSEGFTDLPSTAHELLNYQHSIKMKNFVTKRKTIGKYFYFGIAHGLSNQLSSNVYKDSEIKVLVHIDGMPIYKNSRAQLWPILLKIYNKKYECTPFVAAIFYGDSKPNDVTQFLFDFVQECKTLMHDGLIIQMKTYSFQIFAVVADRQARAYIKSIIGPTEFCACERCEVEGNTVDRKRVYPEINCPLRTKASFKDKRQEHHHKTGSLTSLLDIPNCDPVKDFPLDIMHLAFLNVMKTYTDYITSPSSKYSLSIPKRVDLQRLFAAVTPYVPADFQRSIFDLTDLGHWKANQFAFVLFYLGGVLFKTVMPESQYHHFLRLYVGFRILCSAELAVDYADYAEEQLKLFFELMPVFFGPSCQTLNFHGLIHLADDVRHFQAPLTDYSAFFGENFIGHLKNLVTSKARPLPQIINRLNAIQTTESSKIKLRYVIKNCILDGNKKIYLRKPGEMFAVKSVTLHDMILQDESPNNVVQLIGGKIFCISKLFVKCEFAAEIKTQEQFYAEGHYEEERENVFS